MDFNVSLKIPKNPHKDTMKLLKELEKIIPRSHITSEHGNEIVRVDIAQDIKPQYIVFKTNKQDDQDIQIVFKIIEYKSRDVLRCRSDIINEEPQLVLNNFSTELGIRIAEFMMLLFPCTTKSKQVVNFTVKKEFLHFRMYKYCFSKEGPIFEKIGPHLSLRLWRYIEYGEEKKVLNFDNFIKNQILL